MIKSKQRVRDLIFAAAIGLAITSPAQAQTVQAPTGWSESQQGDKRVLTKGDIRIEIGPWQSLNGQSVRNWLKAQERKVTAGITYVSTQSFQAEPAVAGSYSLARTVRSNGAKQISVLYACPGRNKTVKLMQLRAVLSYTVARDVQRGAKFGEEVCAADSNVEGSSAAPRTTTTASKSSVGRSAGGSSTSQSLAAHNAKIPAANRPRTAHIVLKDSWVGFPATLVSKATPQMTFPNGYSTTCAKWNPITQSPTPASAGKLKRCKMERVAGKGKPARRFKPGETIDVAFGRITGFTGLGGSSSISGGTLRMTKDGRIKIGGFRAFSASGSGSSVSGGSRKKAVSGRYYLSGHTITIESDSGQIYHGFIAASTNRGGRGFDNVFINGEHYWDRND